MVRKPRTPMAVSDRAKQFMPFKAVAGLDEALERKRIEMETIEKCELFDDCSTKDA